MRHHAAPDMSGNERIVLDNDDVRFHVSRSLVLQWICPCALVHRIDSLRRPAVRFQSPDYGIIADQVSIE
jgi:hypothetical protein